MSAGRAWPRKQKSVCALDRAVSQDGVCDRRPVGGRIAGGLRVAILGAVLSASAFDGVLTNAAEDPLNEGKKERKEQQGMNPNVEPLAQDHVVVARTPRWGRITFTIRG